jgi:hypothetical protein
MKQQGSELGSLASRFFAYIQLKKKEIVRLKRGIYLVPPRLQAGGRYSLGK